MHEDVSNESTSRGSTIRAIIAASAVIFGGPLIGVLLAHAGIVLAPPWTPFTNMIYLPIACLSIPIGILVVAMGWIRARGLVLALVISGFAVLFYLALIGPWLPGGMTDCQSMASSGSQIHYYCVSTSSDSADYRYEFILRGQAGWPVMRMEPLNQAE